MPSGGASGGRVYAGRTSEQRHAGRRERLLSAALEAFARDGWDGATVTNVCREAKLSARSFYELFPSREALFIAVADGIAEDVQAIARGAVAREDQSPDERARGVLDGLARYFTDDPRTVRVALIESLATPALRAHRSQLLRSLAEFAARLMRALDPDPDAADPAALELSAFLLSGGVVEALMAAADDEPAAPREALVEHLARLYEAAAAIR